MTAPASMRRFEGGRGILAVSLGCAALGTLGLVLGAIVARVDFFFAYLTAYAFVTSIGLGALILLMTCHAMRAAWPVAVRRLLEAIVGALPILPLLFVPLLFGLRTLYPWLSPARIADPHARELVEHKLPYLNLPFFLIRTAIYFAIWIGCGWLLRRWSLLQDRDAAHPGGTKAYVLSAAALPAVGLALAFASFDWTMSLTPTWYSTMYPIYWFGGGFVAAIALLAIVATGALRAGYVPLVGSHFYALGRLMLAFTIFWAYAAYFQLMLIWIADKPIEASFFVIRWSGAWRVESIALGLTKFAVPFFALLNYRIKWRPRALSAVAIWMIAAHYLDMHWLVAPAARPRGPVFHWLDIAALAAIGGVVTAFATWRLRGHATVPINDARLAKALSYDSV